MLRIRLRSALLLFSLTVVLVTGCGSGAGVSGSVKIDGQAVDVGGIAFFKEGTKEPAASGRVAGGRYELPRNPKMEPGKYTVKITWLKPTGKKVKSETDSGVEEAEVAEYIPYEYNTQSKLSVEISSGSNTHDFDLKGGGKVAPTPGPGKAGSKPGGD